MAILAALLLPALAAAQCTTRIRVGTFDEATPGALAIMTDWLNDDADECWTFYRQPSGGLSTAKLESGDLDLAYVGSTPYAAATARRGALKAVAVAHKKGEAQALITRARLEEPKDLGGTTIAAPYVSTTHYIALAVIANAGMDLTSLDLKIMAPADIVEAWDAGTIDGACVWGSTMSHLLNNPWGGSADALDQGRVMVSASTVAEWSYQTGNVVAASDAFLAAHRALVEKFVVAVARTQNDYVKSVQTGGWSEDYNPGVQGDYNDAVADFAYLVSDSPVGTEERKDAFDRLARFEFLSVEDQLDADKIDVPKMTQDSAYFFYEQKVLAEDPSGADQVSHYENYYDKTILTGLTTSDYEPLLATDTAFSATNEADVQREATGDGDKCPTAGSRTATTAGTTFTDGSSSPNAYAAGADCIWTVTPSTSTRYVNIEITKLMSEQPVDGLEVYDKDGDLLAAFTGRLTSTVTLPQIRSSVAGAVTVRWSTDNYDENAIGYLEDVGFQLTAKQETSASCGTDCAYDHCLGVVTETGSGTISASSQGSYAPNSRCGWRIEASSTYVELEFTKLAIENGVDFVRIYEGSTAPTGFSLTDPATEPKLLYAATGSTLPPKLTFQGSVFVTFESDGLGNTAVGATGDGGFELEYRTISASSSLGNNCNGDWTSPIKNCALDHCTGTQKRDGAHVHGSFSSSSGQSAAAATDYPAMTTCRWEFEVSPDFTGLSFKALVWDVEASGALTSTTDAVKIYQQGADGEPSGDAVATLKGGDDPADWDFDFSATSGKFVAVFASDLNNPVPKKGFDLIYAGMYGASAGMMGGFCSDKWDCVEGECRGGTCEDPKGKGGEIPPWAIGMIIAMCVLLLGLAVLLYFLLKNRKKMKAKLKGAREELQNFRDSVVGMRAVVKAAAPGGGGGGGRRAAPPAAPARWYWEESPARLAAHPVVKPPHWIPYDDATSARLEKAFVARQGKIQLTAAYEADVERMLQTNLRTGFSRNMMRDAPPVVPVARPASRDVEQGADRPSDIDADEPCMVLHVGSIVQIARERDDGWAFGSLMLAAAGAPTDAPPVGWSLNQGWFEMENTEVPSADQLAELQKALGGSGGASALDPPAYWDEVRNPLEGELFRLDPRDAKTADEYRRVQNAFLLTLPAKNFRIYSIDRVQNVSLWQSYSVKKSQICAREEDESKALRKYVRCWLFHGCPGDIVPKILQQGFNRSFCGKNATFYGKGVYFARDAKYSTYPLYCRPDPQGVQSIFLVRAVVGQYCKGVKDALTPEVRDAAKNLLYDSTVDTDPGKEPSIYVTYHDAQAYPEYLIKFSQTNVPKAHPSAGEAPHRMYRHNILEAEGIE